MLHYFRDEGLVPPTYLAKDTLQKVDPSAPAPEKIEDTDVAAKRWAIGFDHAECAVDAPKHEKDDEQMVGVPETFVISAARFLDGCE